MFLSSLVGWSPRRSSRDTLKSPLCNLDSQIPASQAPE